jgi:3-oxoacyl-[acyl-carrier-protein] synthase-3
MHAKNFEKESARLEELKQNPIIAFEKEFLRWMLSDGAGAALLQDKPDDNRLSLRIDWFEMTSYAGRIETCMYAGAEKNREGGLHPWRDMSADELSNKSIFSLKQDVKILGENIVEKGTDFLANIINKKNFDIEKINWFLPHLSSNFFREKIMQSVSSRGINIPAEKWFTNLSEVGNVGAASAYLMLEELMREKRIKKNQKILIMVPESARFSYSYIHLTAV